MHECGESPHSGSQLSLTLHPAWMAVSSAAGQYSRTEGVEAGTHLSIRLGKICPRSIESATNGRGVAAFDTGYLFEVVLTTHSTLHMSRLSTSLCR